MVCRLNLEHVRALCRLHPCMVRDALIKRIEAEMMEACRVEGKLGWKSSLEELKEGLLQGLLAWLPLNVSSLLVQDLYPALPFQFSLLAMLSSFSRLIFLGPSWGCDKILSFLDATLEFNLCAVDTMARLAHILQPRLVCQVDSGRGAISRVFKKSYLV